jgi:L-ascorbate metabolism protein UlaG (beta-lactamase superfamily)
MTTKLGVRFTWFGHACVELVLGPGTTVLIDPWFGNPRSTRSAESVTACDVMLVTHGHGDHVGDAIDIARRLRPAWPAIHEMSLWLGPQLGDDGAGVVGMNKGGTLDVAGIEVTMVRAEHSAGGPVVGPGAVYLGEPVGFVVGVAGGPRVYHAGDTDVFGDMALIGELHRPQVAFLPIGGHYTMDPRAAARAVALLGVSTIVPIHYGTFPALAGTPEQLHAELAAIGLADVRVLAPGPGEMVQL